MSQLNCLKPVFFLLFYVTVAKGIRYGSTSTTLHFPSTEYQNYHGTRFETIVIDDTLADGVGSEAGGRIVDKILERSRRSVSGGHHQSSENITSTAVLNDTHYQMIVHWAGEGSSVIIALAKDPRPSASSTSAVYLSQDYGKSFTEIQSSKMYLNDRTPALIEKFYNSPSAKSHYVFADVKNNYTFVTENYCRTVISHHAPFAPRHIAFHGTSAHLLVGHDDQDPQKRLWVSSNSGATWRSVQSGVKSFFWGKPPLDPRVALFVQREESLGLSTVIKSDDLFLTPPVTLISNVVDFELVDEYMFATKRNTSGLSLHVSYNREAFLQADFPDPEGHRDYFIADATEDQVFAVVSHANETSILYISEVRGFRFSHSLSNIVYFNPDLVGSPTFSWLRLAVKEPFADLHKVQGLRGIYIASVYNNKSASVFNQSSYITFNKGSSWLPITAPTEDSEGKSTNCSAYSFWPYFRRVFHAMYQMTRSVPILSKENAVGLIMATGNTGTSISRDLNVYLSTDAGMSWSEVLKGQYFYAFGDHGGIIVAAARGRLTGEILYSHDEGETWESYEFTKNKVFIYGVLTEPGEKTTTFSLFGSQPGPHSWILIQVNLSSVLGNPCSEDDYKRWSPTDNPRVDCLLGRKTVYERRRAHSLCLNTRYYDRMVSSENCTCSGQDYECDVGFVQRSPWSVQCVYNSSSGVDVYRVPPSCHEGGYYFRTRGYRRISGDTCEGGLSLRYDPEQISCPVAGNEEFILYTTRTHLYRYMFGENTREEIYTPTIQNALAVDYNYHSNCVYWADAARSTIEKLCLDGRNTSEVLVTDNLESIEGLAYDWMSDQLYWVDSGVNRIEVARGDGSHRRALVKAEHLDNPRAIVLCPKYGLMFWTDWSSTHPRIMRSWMDGTHITPIVQGTMNLHWPNGVAIDYQLDRVYYTDAYLHSISYISIHGSDIPHLLIRDPLRLPHLYAIDIYKDDVYVTDWSRHAILAVNKGIAGSPVEVIASNLGSILDLKILHRSSQQGSSPCSRGNGGCSSLCMERPQSSSSLTPLNRSCICSDIFPIKVTTSSGNEQCLCANNRPPAANSSCHVTGNETTCPPPQFTCLNSRCIPSSWKCDHDNDCGDMSDERDCPYRSCSPSQFTCANQRCIPSRWVCDHDNDCGDGSDEELSVCNASTCAPSQFTCANLRCIPSSWVCDGDNDCHDMSDESNCTNGETTTAASTCSWSDFRCHSGYVHCVRQIWVCDGEWDCSDGSDESNCNSSITTEVPQCESWYQYRCGDGSCIPRSWVCNGYRDCSGGEDEADCTTTTPYPWDRTTAASSCTTYRNFHCGDDTCIYRFQVCDGVSDCSDNSDESDCDITSITTCRPGFRACDDGVCISTLQWCDGVRHCYDGSDEAHCGQRTCSPYMFQCLSENLDCLPMHWVCDGEPDCPNGDDEQGCHGSSTCRPSEFSCQRSEGCVPMSSVCDGFFDCIDGSDEEYCNMTFMTTPAPAHSKWKFPCADGSEIDLHGVCDGIRQCRTGADESVGCVTNYTLQLTASVRNGTVTLSWPSFWVPRPTLQSASVIVYLCNTSGCFMRNVTAESNRAVFNDGTESNEHYHSGSYYYWGRVVKGNQINPPSDILYLMLEIVPQPPQNVSATVIVHQQSPYSQPEQVIQVTWLPPPGGYQYFQVYCLDEDTGVMNSARADKFAYIIPSEWTYTGHTYQIHVITWDTDHSSPSKKVKVMFDSLNSCFSQSPLHFFDIKDRSVRVSWTKTEQAVMYRVNFTSALTLEKVVKPAAASLDTLLVPGLCPGVSYDVVVEMRTGAGKFSHGCTASISTSGVSHAPQLSVRLTSTISVTASWQNQDTVSGNSNYILYYSTTPNKINDLQSAEDAAAVEHFFAGQRSTVNIDNLEACKTYCFRVQLTSPCRGQLSDPVCVNTDKSDMARPTHVAVSDKNIKVRVADMKVRWSKPCEHDPKSLSYAINVTEEGGNSQIFTLDSTRDTHLHKMIHGVQRGAKYHVAVWVNSQWVKSHKSTELVHVVAPYPPPVDFSAIESYDCPGCMRLHWRKPADVTADVTFVVQNTFDINMDAGKDEEGANFTTFIETTNTSILVKDSQPKTKVYFRVCMRVYGYLSQCSSAKEVLEPRIAASTNTKDSKTNSAMIGGLVASGLVVVIVSAMLVFYIVRHRRLQHSFASFANSHYDRQAGTTTFSASDDLEGDDVPMIRGFADDEPLVVA